MVDRAFNAAVIAAHNEYRAAHGCPKLEFDAQLAADSQQYAEKLIKAGQLKHSECEDYGENLAMKGSGGKAELTGQEASRMWYDEIRLHNFDAGFSHGSGHFTQMIWKSTKKAGFGIASSPDGHTTFVVGRYRPPGNVYGEFPDNVPLPLTGRVKMSQPTSKPSSAKSPSSRVVIVREQGATGDHVKKTSLGPNVSSDQRFQDRRRLHTTDGTHYS